MLYWINILAYLLSLVLSFVATPYILNMLIENKCVCLNYREESIPISVGLLFIIVQTITCSGISILGKIEIEKTMIYLVAFILIGLVGLLDDLVGDKKVKGFRGHIISLFKGKLTTGGLKASVGFLVSLIVSLSISKNIYEIVLNTLLIALFTNLINLFDLRPGRAGKVFIGISVVLLFTSKIKGLSIILFSLLGILTRYLPIDLKAKGMMGDIGSNSLGITLGIYCALTHTIHAKIIYLCLLIVIQLASEFISFSKLIEKNKILRFIDNLGR